MGWLSKEVSELQDQYKEKFGKLLCYFAEYDRDIFVKTLEEAIKTGKPVNVKKMVKSMNIRYEKGVLY